MAILPSLLSLGCISLLAVPGGGGARAGSAPDAARDSGWEALCGHETRPRPTITGTTVGRTTKYGLFLVPYGGDVNLLCSSSDASKLTIRYNERPVQATHLNTNAIQVILKKPDTGFHMYYCTDNITGCDDNVFIDVRPAVTITAPRVHYTPDAFGFPLYFVPRGDVYDVLCSSSTLESLSMLVSPYWEEIQTIIVNETTIAATVTDDKEGRKYTCRALDKLGYDVRVIVDHYPEAQSFRCILYQTLKLECTWVTSSTKNIFKLFIKHHDHDRSTFLCSDRPGGKIDGCVSVLEEEWDLEYGPLQLQTCNEVFCDNQTFPIDYMSIMKLDPVYDLKMINVSSRGAAVAWRRPAWHEISAYRVEYRLLGTEWRQVNVSAVRCSEVCELLLALPCPDAHYEVRVYVVLGLYPNILTSDPEHLSEPVSLYFFTAPSDGVEVNPACDEDFREPTPRPTAKHVLYDIRELIRHERKETKALKKKIDALKQKLAKVKALMDAKAAP